MELTFLDYILIALIFAVVLHLIKQTYGFQFGFEGMDAANQTVDSRFIQPTTLVDLPVVNNVNTTGVENHILHKFAKDVEDNDKSVEDYIDELVTMKKFKNRNSPNVQTTCDKEEYLNNFWGMQDNLNLNSSGNIDMVDKLNEMYLSDNNELMNEKGEKVSDVYNKLVENSTKKSESSFDSCNRSLKNCGDVNMLNKVSNYNLLKQKNGANGNSSSRFDWKYDSDEVNNGGKWFNDVEGNDDNFSSHLML